MLKKNFLAPTGDPGERLTCDECGCVMVDGTVIEFGSSAGREPDYELMEDICPFYAMEDLTSCSGNLAVTEEDAARFDAMAAANAGE